MIFPFRPISLGSSGMAGPRSRPIAPLRVYGKGRVQSVDVLIDTGADEVLLPTHLLPLLGFAPGTGRTRPLTGVGGRSIFHYFDVELELVAGPNSRVWWQTPVGFGPVPPRIGLFGIAGGLEFFQLTINVIDGWFSLYPHPLVNALPPTVYPHTPFPIP